MENAYSYEHNSHYHCWAQKQPSACGIPLEKHTQCCLCSLPVPTQTWRESWVAQLQSGAFLIGGKADPQYVVDLDWVQDLIRTELTKARQEGRLEVLEKIEDLAAEFGDDPRCAAIIGEYVGEALHAARLLDNG